MRDLTPFAHCKTEAVHYFTSPSGAHDSVTLSPPPYRYHHIIIYHSIGQHHHQHCDWDSAAVLSSCASIGPPNTNGYRASFARPGRRVCRLGAGTAWQTPQPREHSARKKTCARAKLAAANTAEWWTQHGGPRAILPFTSWVEHSPVVELIGTVSHSHVLRAS